MSFQIQFNEKVIPIATAPQLLSLVNVDAPSFRTLWLQFLDSYPLYSFRYGPAVQEYYKMISGPNAVDLSFVLKNETIPLAICPLVVEKVKGWIQGSYSCGEFLPVPLFHPQLGAKQLRALEAYVFEEATRRLKTQQAQRWLVDADPVSGNTSQQEDLLPARFGALDVSIQCHVMDLTLSEEEIWLQIRHSAKSTINQGLKTYTFKVYDRTNYTPDIGERHALLHHRCSGRITRPLATFEKMYSWIYEDCGLMFEQLYQGQTVQMIFVATGKGTAIGASAADDPDFQWKIPLTHSMNYFIYQECKKRGIKYYEVGDTTFRDSLLYMRSRKVRTIDLFKRSFGRQTLPWKRWMWFPTVDAELRFLDEAMVQYRHHIAEIYSEQIGPQESPPPTPKEASVPVSTERLAMQCDPDIVRLPALQAVNAGKDKMAPIMGTRLCLRLLKPSDVTDEYVGWLNNAAVNRFLEVRFHVQTQQSVEQYVQDMFASPYSYLFSIEVLETKEKIGTIKIGAINPFHCSGQIGLMLGNSGAWGKGYGTETVKLGMQFAFESLRLHSIVASIYRPNVASHKIFKRLGFSEVGWLTEYRMSEGRYVDCVLMEMINPAEAG